MKKLKFIDLIALGFMAFALFVGAGNIIFPPKLGLDSGQFIYKSGIGFLIGAVGLPIITLMALARIGGGMEKLSESLGKLGSVIFCILSVVAVGPLFAIPRTAGVSFDIGVNNFVDKDNIQTARIIYKKKNKTNILMFFL